MGESVKMGTPQTEESTDHAARLLYVEKELVIAQATIQQLQETAQHKAEALHSTEAQLLLYASDLHHAYSVERARTGELEQAIIDLVGGMVNVVEARDTYTGGHSLRVMQYALGIGQALGWTSDQLQILEMGARLHDIGKIGIPDSILQKPAPLNKAEYLEMQTHVVIGIRILDGIQSLASALPYVAYHHEHFNGQGYPFGLAGDAIPEEGRLLAVADAFDAITSARPYRLARPAEDGVREILAHRSTQFDPVMVDALLLAHKTGLLYATAEQPDRPIELAAGPIPLLRWGADLAGNERERSATLDERDLATLQHSRT